MRRILLSLLAFLLALAPAALAAQGPTIRTDPRVELLAIVFRLAGANEYRMGRVPGYVRAIDEHFAPFAGHAVVLEARRLRATRGIGFDAVMSMAIHIDDAETPAPRRPFTAEDPSLERRWTAEEANGFIAKLADFVRAARFMEFIAANRAPLDSAQVRMQRVVDANLELPRILAFFGRQPEGGFTMVPLVANAAGNFGVRFLDGTSEDVYAIIGTSPDSAGVPAFDAGFVPTMVHEFSHSFVNPAVGPVSERFRAAVEAIFPKVEAEMRAQAYGNWLTVVNESLVRASVARYVLATGGEAAARREVADQRARRFLWTDELYQLLGEYEADRARYPTFDAFLPRVAEYFAALAPRVDTMIAAYDRARPGLAGSEPAQGAADVDPALGRIVLRFDQPMAPRVNVRAGPSGSEHFPRVAKVEWDASGTALTLFVELQPAWDYELLLGSGFRARDTAMPLRETPLRFRTR